MTSSHRRMTWLVLLGITVFAPTFFQLGQFGWALDKQKSAPVFRLDVSGFDPRDPVRGRYATLQIDWKIDDYSFNCPLPEKNTYAPLQDCGLCLSYDDKGMTRTLLVDRPYFSQNKCKAEIMGLMAFGTEIRSDSDNTFRVYLPEDIADQVDEALRQDDIRFSADLSFTQNGQPILHQLYADGKPYQDVFKRK